MFELLFDEGGGVGFAVEEDSLESDDVAPPRVPDVAPLRVPDVETVAPEVPSNAPGACSGESRKQDVGVRH
jgi:hypothetical protein